MSKKNSKKNNRNQAAKTRADSKKESISTDVLGSYTGMSYDGSPPVQDADDL